WRDVSYRAFLHNPRYAAFHKLNGQRVTLPPELGGNVGFARGGGHTFFSFVNPAEHGESHPEYFSEFNGKRAVDPRGTQLCLTNPDVLAITIDKVRRILRTTSTDRPIVHVSQMDWAFWCECEHCRTIDEHEKSHAGSLIQFINAIAEAIEDEFPYAYIETFAYQYTRKPPKHVKPRDNVIVRLCSIECDFSRPLADRKSRLNRPFQKDIKAWAKIAPNLCIWDYTQNWYCHQGPHPNFHVLQPNIRFFADHRVKGVFEQASPSSPHSDFEFLKGYIIAHALWDPAVDWQALFDEFVEAYYGEGAPFVREYIEHITRKALEDEVELTIFNPMWWMDYDMVVQAQTIFERAFAAVTDATARERLEYAHLPVQYAALVCQPKIEFTGDKYIVTRPPSQTFDEYWEMIMDHGVTHLQDTPISDFRDRLNGATPPRYLEAHVEKLENEYYEIWVVPDFAGAIVRWIDKASGKDLLEGHKTFQDGRGLVHEWDMGATPQPVPYYPIADRYRLGARTDDSLALEARARDGLVVTRTMTLKLGGETLDIEIAMENASQKPIKPYVELHCEFWTQGPTPAEIWIEKADGWERAALRPVIDKTIWADHLRPDGITRWAFRVPREKLTLVNAFNEEEVNALFYVINVDYEHVVMELEPAEAPLAPGETRTIHTTFAVSGKRPGRL
ncbi:MAG TPA: DUF4838 domain-containing protein, partial [Candidatus Hydrogenedentes bacterium]|nr:DUF4838 domain-containing protein [Candidatus Hydrogenedentota bacterium]